MDGPGPSAADSAAVSAAVVAGGRSARFGSDKRFVTVAGRGLLARTVDLLRTLADDVQVVVADGADGPAVLAAVGPERVTVTVDARRGAGPGAGLEAALAHARHDLVIVVATDHPALATEVLTLLVAVARASDARAVALSGPRGGEPFVAVYRRDALATVRGALDAGTRRMQDLLAALDATLVPEDEWRTLDPSGRSILDVDTRADLDAFGGGTAR